MPRNPNGQPENSPEHLDQIRDIIFGHQKREFDTKLDQLQSSLHELNASLAQRVEELRAAIASLEKKLASLQQSTSHENAALKKHIDEEVARLDAALTTTLHTASERSASLEQMLKETATGLSSDKVSREELGDLLHSLAAHIQQRKT